MSSENQVKTIIDSITQNINEDLKEFTPLKTICDKYNKDPSHVVLIFLAVFILLTMLGLFQHVVITLFGLLYPSYMSFKVDITITQAINSQSQEKCKIWLTYWIVFGFLTAFDKLLGIVLFFIPGYYLIKALFYIWMFYPRTNGAQIIYEKVLKPQLIKFRDLAQKKFS